MLVILFIIEVFCKGRFRLERIIRSEADTRIFLFSCRSEDIVAFVLDWDGRILRKITRGLAR